MFIDCIDVLKASTFILIGFLCSLFPISFISALDIYMLPSAYFESNVLFIFYFKVETEVIETRTSKFSHKGI